METKWIGFAILGSMEIPFVQTFVRLIAIWFVTGSMALGQQPSFIIILCDNLGYGDIEPFGSKVHRTPHLDRMAREGRKFTHFCVTAGRCTPSRASLLTGCYAQRLGLHRTPRGEGVLFPISPYGLHPDEVTMAEILKEQGYATTIIGKWHLGDQPAFLPTRQGFDSYFGIPYSDDMTQSLAPRYRDRYDGDRWPPLPLLQNEKVIEAPVDRNRLTKRYTERALEFIEKNKEGPFFLYLPHAMPGSEKVPFASEAFRGKSRNGLWGDAVEELDWSTGQILDKFRTPDMPPRTLGNSTYLRTWVRTETCPLFLDGRTADWVSWPCRCWLLRIRLRSQGKKIPAPAVAGSADRNLSAFWWEPGLA